MEGDNEATNGSVYWQARSSSVWERRHAAYCLLPLAYCLSVLQSVSVKADGNDPLPGRMGRSADDAVPALFEGNLG